MPRTLSVDADPGDGASIASIAFAGSGISKNSQATSGDTTILTNAGTLAYTVIVTDSRGRTVSDQIDVICYEYSNPVVSTLEVVRCLNDGTASDTEGNYLKAFPVFSYSAVDGNNSLSVKKIEYREQGASSWAVGIAAAVTNMWSAVFGPADVAKAFDVKLTIEDLLGNSFALQVSVQSVVGFALGLKNDRARFGGPVVKPGLQVDWPTEFNDTVDVTNRRCSATLSSSGWYRVMQTKDISGSVFDFEIGRPYQSAAAEAHKVTLMIVGGGKTAFVGEESIANNLYVDKIRVTYGNGLCFVDIHYAASAANEVHVDFIANCKARYDGLTYAESLQAVADAPAGETVLITHEFAAVSKTPVRHGTANGWDYVVYADKTIEATKVISSSMSYYTTVGGFYGYYQIVNTPFTMADTSYYVGASWRIGSGFGIPAGFQQIQTTRFNVYALGTAHGTSENFELYLFLKGTIA